MIKLQEDYDSIMKIYGLGKIPDTKLFLSLKKTNLAKATAPVSIMYLMWALYVVCEYSFVSLEALAYAGDTFEITLEESAKVGLNIMIHIRKSGQKRVFLRGKGESLTRDAEIEGMAETSPASWTADPSRQRWLIRNKHVH